MFKSIFWKQFLLYFGTILVSFALLAVVYSQAFRGYFIAQREELLKIQAQKIADLVMEPRDLDLFARRSFTSRLDEQVKNIQDYMDTSMLFIDENYKVYAATKDIAECNGMTISNAALAPVMEGVVVTIQGKLIDSFPTRMLTVAYPMVSKGQVGGAVILNASIPELEETTSDVFRITLVGIVATGMVAFVFIYFSSRTITKPLLAMNEAAKVIADGDFEKRIEVKSRDEVGQLGESFNNMAESLERQEQLRQEFITNISHDIRSPLTSMRGFLQAILDGTVPPEKTERYLSIALDETERLSKLANDILDLNKVQSSGIELQRSDFDINELIRKTVLMFETRITDNHIILNIGLADEVSIVSADYEKIQRVVYNLLDNAVKFTPKGGEISVETFADGKKIFVSVTDNGCGIGEEFQKKIFDRFFKIDSSRSEYKSGSGLGLSIVQVFIKAHGENLKLESSPGKGSRFRFSMERKGA